MILAVIIEIVLVLIFILSIRQKSSDNGFLTASETKTLEGYLSVLIVLCHIPVHSTISSILGVASMVLIVTLFCFFSSYGIAVCQETDNYYYKKLPGRFIYILIPYIISILVKTLIGDNPYSGGTMWMNTLLISYVVAYLAYRVFPNYAFFLIVVFWIVYCFVSHFFDIPWFSWGAQSLGYAYGTILAKYRKYISGRIRGMSKTAYILTVGVTFFLILPVGFYYLKVHNPSYLTTESHFLRIIMTMLMLVLVLIFLAKFCIRNALLSYLGKINLWTFLWHGMFIGIFINMGLSDGVLILCVLGSTIMLASVSAFVSRYIIRSRFM